MRDYKTILKRRDTAANWTAVNPVLLAGEDGFETDTGKTKTGDGVSHWNDLAYPGGASEISDINGLQTALNSKQNALGFTPENAANKNTSNGYAGLDSGGKVAAAQLPSFVDDVLEYANTAAFPVSGETSKIYVALDSNKTYRWSGSVYVEISASPGSTDAITEGATNKYFTAARVRDVLLTGISFATATAITATDTILTAFGKLQAQISFILSKLVFDGDGNAFLADDGTYKAAGDITLLKSSNQNTNGALADDAALVAVIPAGNYRLRAELFMRDQSGGVDGVNVAVGGMVGLAAVYSYGIDAGNLINVVEQENGSQVSVTGSEALKIVIEGVTVSDGIAPIQIQFGSQSGATVRMRQFSTLTLSKI